MHLKRIKRMSNQEELIKRLRKYYDLSEDMVSDENLLYTSKGAYARCRIELRMEIENCINDINCEIKKWINTKR